MSQAAARCTVPWNGPRRPALETRRRILDAAVRLHAQGITEVRPIAEAVGVSLPTVPK